MEQIRVYELYNDFWYNPFWVNVLYYLVIGLLCGLVLVVLVRYFYKKKKRPKAITPWEHALQELGQLQPEQFEGYERQKEFYSKITCILKTYLGARYELHLLEKTDYEALKDLQRVIGSSLMLEKLDTIMSGAVWAKFAPQDVVRQKMNEHLSNSIAIVKKTRPSQSKNS